MGLCNATNMNSMSSGLKLVQWLMLYCQHELNGLDCGIASSVAYVIHQSG